jgi:hypothetical protein
MSNPSITIKPRRTVVSIELPGTQGPPGIPGGGGSESSQEAESETSIVPGQPLCIKTTGLAAPARANTIATAKVVGLALNAASPGSTISYAIGGAISLTDWTPIVGSVNLSPGAFYFLSATQAGRLATVAPSGAGEVTTIVGQALSVRKLAINVQPYIRL